MATLVKFRLLGEVFEPQLSLFSKNYFPLPWSTCFVIAPGIGLISSDPNSWQSTIVLTGNTRAIYLTSRTVYDMWNVGIYYESKSSIYIL